MTLARREPKRPARKEPKRDAFVSATVQPAPAGAPVAAAVPAGLASPPVTPKKNRIIDVLTPCSKRRKGEPENAEPVPSTTIQEQQMTPPSTPNTVYSIGKALFQRGTVANGLIGRSAEREKLLDFFRPKVLNRGHGALYISGVPGTGKSALLSEVLNTIYTDMSGVTPDMEIRIANINCMIIDKPEMVYNRISRELDTFGGAKPRLSVFDEDEDQDLALTATAQARNARALEKRFLDTSSTTRNIVVLDELDHLITKDQEVLFKAFQWAFAKDSNLILVGIANALDLTDRFLPRLRANDLTPESFVFSPYGFQEIANIIESRLKALPGLDQSSPLPLMHPAAIQLAARKTASNTGDLRKAFDICRRSIELVEEEVRRKHATDGKFKEAIVQGDNYTSFSLQEAPRVTVMHVSKICSQAFGGSTVARVKALNLQQKAVLAVLVQAERLMGRAPGPRMSVSNLFEEYGRACSGDGLLARLQLGEFFDLISALEFAGVVAVSGVCGRKGLGSAAGRSRTSRGGGGASASKSSYLGARDDYAQRRISSNIHYLDMITAIQGGREADIMKRILVE